MSSNNRKRRHPDSAGTTQRTSQELLQLVESPNFEELCRRYPAFEQAFRSIQQTQKQPQQPNKQQYKHVAFASAITPAFSIALTRALLQVYFDIAMPHLPIDHLCPPVPNRFFYIHWLRSHLLATIEAPTNRGIDIGVGASCVYPLLAAKYCGWNMLGTDVDAASIQYAQANVDANRLGAQIQLRHVPPGDPLARALQACDTRSFDFVMTNPPFYDCQEQARRNDGRERAPMTSSEGSYPGGEVGFCTDILIDSLRNPSSALWFTTMMGKKTSLTQLHKLLIHMLGPAHVETAEYGPGQHTRWFLAWTLRTPSDMAPSARLPPHPKDTFVVSCNVPDAAQRIATFCASSPGGWQLQTTRAVRGIMTIQERNPPQPRYFVDEDQPNATLPQRIRTTLQEIPQLQLLPSVGHFVIHVKIAAIAHGAAQVSLQCYRHSSRGMIAIEKIRGGMDVEICRTSRKWRRLLKRQNDANMES